VLIEIPRLDIFRATQFILNWPLVTYFLKKSYTEISRQMTERPFSLVMLGLFNSLNDILGQPKSCPWRAGPHDCGRRHLADASTYPWHSGVEWREKSPKH
jgi:hypothetical protein